ncbi:MAG TPA: hypothetical protein IAB72_02880 [Candidatus Onthoplasma faecipullorum]|nr:hypothetical protein [Candidatus Onthoplasma faecipullorum]
MSDNEKKSGFKFLEKLKKIKHIEVYIAIIFIVVLLLIYLGNFNKSSGTSTNNSSEMTVTAYIDDLENRLQEILSNIGGVSDVKVLITLDMDTATVNDSNIVLDKFPAIKGVLITAKGVGDTATKLKVLHAVEAVIDITNGNIEILSSE